MLGSLLPLVSTSARDMSDDSDDTDVYHQVLHSMLLAFLDTAQLLGRLPRTLQVADERG